MPELRHVAQRHPDLLHTQTEKLPELRVNQGVLYVREGEKGYSLVSGYLAFGDERSDHALVAPEHVKDSGQFARAFRNYDNMQKGHTVYLAIPPDIQQKVFKETQSLPYADLRRLNPSRRDVQEEIEQSFAMQQSLMQSEKINVLPDRVLQEEAHMKPLRAGRMTADTYRIMERRAAYAMHNAFRDTCVELPAEEGGDWPFLLRCLELIDRALESARSTIEEFIREQQTRHVELRRGYRAKEDVNVRTKRELEQRMLSTSIRQLQTEQLQNDTNSQVLRPYLEARQCVLNELGKLVAANRWYHESNTAQQN